MSVDGKETMEEVIPLEQWPRLTEDINRSSIDAARIPTINLDIIDTYSHDTLRTFARDLGIAADDVKSIKTKIGNTEHLRPDSETHKGSPLIISRKKYNGGNLILFVHGLPVVFETRNDKGNLVYRAIYSEGKIAESASYTDEGLLDNKSSFADDMRTGAYYRWDLSGGAIRYYLHSQRISKEAWLRYVEESKRLIKDAPALVNDVGSLISSYMF